MSRPRKPLTPAERIIILALAAASLFVVLQISRAEAGEIVTMQSAVGPIEVAPDFGARILPVIAELKVAGFSGIAKCYARRRGPHVKHSAHLDGHACDLLPRDGVGARHRNRMPTQAIMFTATAAGIISRAGLRNGCAFRDCGHIDDRAGVARRFHRTKLGALQ